VGPNYTEIITKARETATQIFDTLEGVADDNFRKDLDEYIKHLESENTQLFDETEDLHLRIAELEELVKLMLDGAFYKTIIATDAQFTFIADYDVNIEYLDHNDGTHTVTVDMS
jgi:hypothetical protein